MEVQEENIGVHEAISTSQFNTFEHAQITSFHSIKISKGVTFIVV